MRELECVIIPEILASLTPADPRAIRSRRDLIWLVLYQGKSESARFRKHPDSIRLAPWSKP